VSAEQSARIAAARARHLQAVLGRTVALLDQIAIVGSVPNAAAWDELALVRTQLVDLQAVKP
jgi:hypothetical protein